MSQPMTWAPGATVPGTVYRIIRPLGSGGMGDVYEAEHAMLGVRRALKVLNRRMAARSDLAERMRVEARALAAIAHPNLVQVLDLGISTDGRMFFAMELLEGATLRDVIARQGRLAPEHAAAIAAGVLEGLAAAHERGLVHRDVKPENVFVTKTGAIKVLDFGIAKTLAGGDMSVHHLTATGMAVGTPRYMAPEQSQGQPVDARADIYSVGVLLWEMLAGRPPFHDLEAIAAAVAAVTRGVPSLEESGVHVPPALSAIVRRATAREAADRFPSAAAMRAELTGADPRGGTLRMGAVPTGQTGAGALASLVATPDRISRVSTPGDAALAVAPTEFHTTPSGANSSGANSSGANSSGANSSVRGGTAPLDVRGLPTPTSAPAPGVSSSASAATPPPVAATTSSAGAQAPGRGLGVVWMVAPIVLGALALGAWIAFRTPRAAPQDATASAAPPPVQSAPPPSATAAAPPAPTASTSATAQAAAAPRGGTEPPRPAAGKTAGKTAAAQAAPPGPAAQPEPAPAPPPPKAKPGGLPSSGLD